MVDIDMKGILEKVLKKVKALSDWQEPPLMENLGYHETAINAPNYIDPKPYRRMLLIQPTWATANYITYAWVIWTIEANQSSFTIPNMIRVSDGYVMSSGTAQTNWWTFRAN